MLNFIIQYLSRRLLDFRLIFDIKILGEGGL